MVVLKSQISGKRNLSTDSTDETISSKRHASVLDVHDLNESVFNTPDLFSSQEIPSTGDILILDELKDSNDNDANSSNAEVNSCNNVDLNNSSLKNDSSILVEKNDDRNSIDDIDNSTAEALLNINDSTSSTVSVPVNVLNSILISLESLKNDNKDLKITVAEIKSELKNNRCTCKTSDESYSSRASSDVSNATNNIISSQIPLPKAKDIKDLKLELVPDWGRKFNYRRKQFKNLDKNLRRAEIYKNFLSDPDNIYIVKRSRPKFASDIRDFRLAEKLSIEEMQVQIKRWEGYAEQSRKNIDSVDLQVYNLVGKHEIEEERGKLTRQWGSEVRTAETKAAELNINELQFMIDLPNTDPYKGFVDSVKEHRPQNRGWYKRDYYKHQRLNTSNYSRQDSPRSENPNSLSTSGHRHYYNSSRYQHFNRSNGNTSMSDHNTSPSRSPINTGIRHSPSQSTDVSGTSNNVSNSQSSSFIQNNENQMDTSTSLSNQNF